MHSQKNLFKLLSDGMVDDASVLFESPSLELNFCYLSLSYGCGYFPGRAEYLCPPSTGGFLHFTERDFFFTCVVPHPGLAGW
jgi:hypothetical protein